LPIGVKTVVKKVFFVGDGGAGEDGMDGAEGCVGSIKQGEDVCPVRNIGFAEQEASGGW